MAGKHKGRDLGTLSAQELRSVGASRVSGDGAEKQRAWARAVIACRDLEPHLPQDSQPRSPDAEPLAIVLHAKAAQQQQTADIHRPWTAVLGWPVWATHNVLRCLALLLCLVVLYPPMAALPAKLAGFIVRLIAERLQAATSIFCEAFLDQLGSLAGDAWTWLDSLVSPDFGPPSQIPGSTTYPVGKACTYAIIGSILAQYARR